MTIKCFLDTSSTYWIGVSAHEYSHFLQCINESEYWIDFQIKVSSINNLNNLFDQPALHQFSLRLQYFIDFNGIKSVFKKNNSSS